MYNTDHVLTNENIGKDLGGTGKVELPNNAGELNPHFDFRTDFVSRRFHASESTDLHLELSATLRF